MAAVVKLIRGGRPASYLGISEEYNIQLSPTVDGMGVRLPATEGELLNGEQAGKIVEDVKPNQVVRIRPSVRLNLRTYPVILGYNSALNELGSVSISPVTEPISDEIYLVIKAYKSFNISELDHVFKMWMVD